MDRSVFCAAFLGIQQCWEDAEIRFYFGYESQHRDWVKMRNLERKLFELLSYKDILLDSQLG